MKKFRKSEGWITIKEACELTGKHYETIRSWVRKGLIEGKRVYNTGSSPLYINKLSIPAFLRKDKNEKDKTETIG